MFPFLVHLIDLLSRLLRCNGFSGVQKAAVDLTGRRPPNNAHDLSFGASLALGSALELPLGPTTELIFSSCCTKPIFFLYITIQARNDFLLLGRIREDVTSKSHFLKFLVSSQGTHLLSLFTFPICFKCQMTVEWSMLSSLATSHVFIRRSALITSPSWSLSNCDVWPLHYSSSSLSSPLQNFLNQLYTVHSLAVPGLNVLLMLQVVFTALQPILNLNKKIP